MIGPVLIAISWVLLRLEGKGLRALGFDRPLVRLRQLTAGFLLAGGAAALQQLGYALASGTTWVVNPSVGSGVLLESLRWTANSVLYEELVFRGYLLYQAIRFFGPRLAVGLGAAAFGVYHWFSYGALGDPGAMAFIFVFTGLFGWMFCRAFADTGSVAAPIGLHLGWNLVSYVIFSAGPLGATVLIPASGEARLQADGWGGLLVGIFLPIALVAGASLFFSHGRRTDLDDSVLPVGSVA